MNIYNPRNLTYEDRDFYDAAPFRLIYLHILGEGDKSSRKWALKACRIIYDRKSAPRNPVHTVGSKLKTIENRCAYLHSHKWQHSDVGTWLNLYRVVHCYGGPEEGGWWYWMFEPVNGKRIDHMSQLLQEEYYQRVNRMYGPPEHDYSYRSEYLLARIEEGCPKFPGPRPYYC